MHDVVSERRRDCRWRRADELRGQCGLVHDPGCIPPVGVVVEAVHPHSTADAREGSVVADHDVDAVRIEERAEVIVVC